jgi:glycopeptide antibiotics resistance protein
MLLKMMFRAAGVLYSSLLFYIFFLARRRPRPSLTGPKFPHNLIPVKHKLEELALFHSMRAIDKWNFLTDLLGNIVLFIPLPFFLVFIFKIKPLWKTILIAFIISSCVEVTQYILHIGVADIDDIICNTLGAVIGTLVVKLFTKYFKPQQLSWLGA